MGSIFVVCILAAFFHKILQSREIPGLRAGLRIGIYVGFHEESRLEIADIDFKPLHIAQVGMKVVDHVWL